jgi:redox-sensing transcriptional repressor
LKFLRGFVYNVKYLYSEIGKILGLEQDHNIIIIGAGAAGMSAGIYSGRAKMKTLRRYNSKTG